MQTIGWYVWHQDSYSPVSWVRVRVKFKVRVRVRVSIKVPNLIRNRMYVTGKVSAGLRVLESVRIHTFLCQSVSTANLRPHSKF